MPVQRLAHYRADDPYTRVPNAAIRDDRLDLKTRGLLLMMLSKPDGWRFTERNLAAEAGVSRDQVRSAMARLVETGYVERVRIVVDGRPVHETRVYDRPVTAGSDGHVRPVRQEPDEGREIRPPVVGKPDGRDFRPVSKTETSKTEQPLARPASRERDLLFEAVVAVTGQDPRRLTRTERGRINKALKDLREVGATPEQVRAAARRWTTVYPGATLTATGLAAQWTKVAPAAAAATCRTCGQDMTTHDDDVCEIRSR